MYYLIKETLEKCSKEMIRNNEYQYVAVLSREEWLAENEYFDMVIDLDTEPDQQKLYSTKAEANYDSLTGTFCIPERDNFPAPDLHFSFALDEKGIVFIDDDNIAAKLVENIRKTRRWRFPGLERFMYDFLEQIIKDDARLLEDYERELDRMEDGILSGHSEDFSGRISEIRSDIRDLGIHYEQLTDLGEVLVENENGFFRNENLRYFHLFLNRIARLRDTAISVRDYTIQLRDLQKSQLDIKQNHIMSILTVVTTIFMPLTLIVGWYGMNFRYMPELESRYAYPALIAVCAIIVMGLLIFFKKKKWL